jgi:hypothetical protein
MIARRRATRRAALVGIAMLFLPSLWSGNYLRSSPARSHVRTPLAASTPKMTASDVEQQLRHALTSEAVRDHSCAQGRDGWDYVCAYRTWREEHY